MSPSTIVGLQLEDLPARVPSTSTVVVAECRTTKLRVPDAPLGPWANAVSLLGTAVGARPESWRPPSSSSGRPTAGPGSPRSSTRQGPSLWSCHPPRTGWGRWCSSRRSPTRSGLRSTEPGTVKVTVASPLASVVEPLVMVAVTAPPPPAGQGHGQARVGGEPGHEHRHRCPHGAGGGHGGADQPVGSGGAVDEGLLRLVLGALGEGVEHGVDGGQALLRRGARERR